MNFDEWLKSLTPNKQQTAGEDLADSIALMVIAGLLFMVVFL
jgi:hypothetical protein